MSHVAIIKLEVKDLACLSLACQRLGLQLLEGQQTFKWFGRWANDYSALDAAYKHGIKPKDYGKCQHAIRMVGNEEAYEIGLIAQPNGSYSLAYDFYAQDSNITRLAGGRELNKLKQWYGAEVAKKHAAKQGWQGAKIVLDAQGRPKVTATML